MLSLRAMKCYDNMTINMDESPQSTPSRAPVVLKSVPIYKSDNAVMVKQSRTAGLPCRSPSHSLPPLGRLSAPAALPQNSRRDTEMKTKDVEVCTHTDKIAEYTRTRGFYLTSAGLKSPLFSHSVALVHAESRRLKSNMVENGYPTSQQVRKLALSHRRSARERRLATSCLQSHYAQSGRIHRTQSHRDREDDPRPPDYTTI